MSGGSSDLAKDLETVTPLLKRTLTRRRMLHITGGALAAILLGGCGPEGSGGGDTTATSTSGAGETITGAARGIVFNTASEDVTLFDPATNRITDTQPTNAVVRWLSNEQHYWDGESIWTYDFPDNELRAIAIDRKGGNRTGRDGRLPMRRGPLAGRFVRLHPRARSGHGRDARHRDPEGR